MENVLYMCFSNELNRGGLVFPKELDEQYQTIGLFIIGNYGVHNKYSFKVLKKGELENYILIKNGRNSFSVSIMEREYIFEALPIVRSINRYVGKELVDYYDFAMLIPCNRNELENLCKENDIYFVGEVIDGEKKIIEARG